MCAWYAKKSACVRQCVKAFFDLEPRGTQLTFSAACSDTNTEFFEICCLWMWKKHVLVYCCCCTFKNAYPIELFLCMAMTVMFVSNCTTSLPPKSTSTGFSVSAESGDLSHCVPERGHGNMHTPRLLIMQGYHDGIHFSSPSLLRASGLFTCEFLP